MRHKMMLKLTTQIEPKAKAFNVALISAPWHVEMHPPRLGSFLGLLRCCPTPTLLRLAISISISTISVDSNQNKGYKGHH